MNKNSLTGLLVVVLALLTAVGPFAIDLYLPTLPALQADLVATEASSQLTLSLFVIGMGVGQLLWGPLSDRLGRRKPLILASVILVLASIGCAIAPNIGVLIVARMLQGVAGSAGVVVGRAVASDLAQGVALTRVFSLIGVIMGVAPVVAPVVGGLLAEQIGWRGIMWVLAGLTVVMALCVFTIIPESLPLERRATGGSGPTRKVRTVLGDRRFVALVLTQAFSFAVMFAFITASAFVIQGDYGLTESGYSLVFAFNALAIVVGGLLNGVLVKRISEPRLLTVAIGLLVIGSLSTFTMSVVVDQPPLILLQASIFITTLSLGPIMANTTSLGLSRHHGATGGLAAAVMGAVQAALGGAVSPLVSVGGVSVQSMALVMGGCALVALVAFGVASAGGWAPREAADVPDGQA